MLRPKPKRPSIDHAAEAKAALAQVESLTAELEAKTTMCREQWFAYGVALLEQRKQMPDKKKFGAWVREHGLNTGLAKRPEVRSKAMWCAERKDELQACTWMTAVHPTEVCRAYCAWKKAEQRMERKCSGGALPVDIDMLLRKFEELCRGAAYVAHIAVLEMNLAAMDISNMRESLKWAAEELETIEAWAAAHPEALVEVENEFARYDQ